MVLNCILWVSLGIVKNDPDPGGINVVHTGIVTPAKRVQRIKGRRAAKIRTPTSCHASKHLGQEHVTRAKTLLPQVQSLARSAQTNTRPGRWFGVQGSGERSGLAQQGWGGQGAHWGRQRSLSGRGQRSHKQVAAALNARARVGCEQSQ